MKCCILFLFYYFNFIFYIIRIKIFSVDFRLLVDNITKINIEAKFFHVFQIKLVKSISQNQFCKIFCKINLINWFCKKEIWNIDFAKYIRKIGLQNIFEKLILHKHIAIKYYNKDMMKIEYYETAQLTHEFINFVLTYKFDILMRIWKKIV